MEQVVEYDSSSSLYEQLLQMRKTGVYVSVHTSNLANAPLLQPGSAVFELIHTSSLHVSQTCHQESGKLALHWPAACIYVPFPT
eukprot:1161311-Pelagomonas_calceolata.AAC.1